MTSAFEQGDTVCISVDGAAAAGNAMSVSKTPVGELWEVLYADTHHNDAANPSGSWYLNDGATKPQIGDGAVLAANTRRLLYTTPFSGPLVMTPGTTLSWEAPAGCTNGSVAHINLIVRKIKGVA